MRHDRCGIILSQQLSLSLHNWRGSYWVESFAECVIKFFPTYLSRLIILDQSSSQKVDGSFIATVLETASVGVLYLAWRNITEGIFQALILDQRLMIIYLYRNMGRWIHLLILFSKTSSFLFGDTLFLSFRADAQSIRILRRRHSIVLAQFLLRCRNIDYLHALSVSWPLTVVLYLVCFIFRFGDPFEDTIPRSYSLFTIYRPSLWM